MRETARRVADVVGDGCVVLLLDSAVESLETVAVDHREPARAARMRALLRRPPLEVTGGWSGQPVLTNAPVSLDDVPASELELGSAWGPADRHVRVFASPVRADGRPIGVVEALRDGVSAPYSPSERVIVERLAAELGAELPADPPLRGLPRRRAWGERLSSLRQVAAERSSAGVWITDLAGRTTYVNEAMSEMLGVPAARMVGERLADHVDDPPDAVAGLLATETERRDRVLLGTPLGALHVEMTSAPLIAPDGSRAGTVNTVVAVEERRRVERDLRLRLQAEEALSRLACMALDGAPQEDLLDSAVRAVGEVLETELAGMAQVLPDRQLHVLSALGWDLARLPPRPPRVWPGTFTELATQTDEPVVLRDRGSGAGLRLEEAARRIGIRAGVVVRVADGRGLLSGHTAEEREFAPYQLAFMRRAAAVLGSRWAGA
ncbi:MAG: PAS domain-containing protein [Thermoleophilaceae bacterium]|nr:PAS domain-containing protein [Thermoleophilaceae bacterium]